MEEEEEEGEEEEGDETKPIGQTQTQQLERKSQECRRAPSPPPPQMLSGCFPDAFRMLGDAGRCLRLWACPPISAPPAELLHDGLRRVGIPAPSVEECPQKPPYESIRRCHGNLPESISGPSVLVGCASFFFSSPPPPLRLRLICILAPAPPAKGQEEEEERKKERKKTNREHRSPTF